MTGLDPWHRFVAGCLRGVYFGRVRVTGAAVPRDHRPRLIVASHRNGAVDGIPLQRAFPKAKYLVSAQLLRNPLLRILFTGIPVVRTADVQRYGMDPERRADPVSAAVRHLVGGGELVVFPEGTSRWGPAPGRYQRGAARIWCALSDRGVHVDVIPVGLFYSAPDRLRSIVELRIGPRVRLPERSPARGSAGANVDEVHEAMTVALDAVSVRCASPEQFNEVQSVAVHRARCGESFARAFLDEHSRRAGGRAASSSRRSPSRWPRRIGLALMWIFSPILLAGYASGRRADGRNTVALFRLIGGLAAAALWMPALAGIAWFWPVPTSVGVISAVTGWLVLGVRRWQPDPDPIASQCTPAAPARIPPEGEPHA